MRGRGSTNCILNASGGWCEKRRTALTGGGVDSMARVVLANFDAEAAEQLDQLLRRNRHYTTQLPTFKSDREIRAIAQISCDLIILDVSKDDRISRAILTEILRRRAEPCLRPMLLCVSRAYRGPRFEYDLERKGARLAYVS